MIIIVLLWCAFYGVQSTPVGCQRLMMKLAVEYQLEGPVAVMKDTLPYLSMSGLGVNRWGDYDACKRKGHLYSTAVITSQVGVDFFGFCHAQECTTTDLDTYENQQLIKRFLNDTGIADQLNINLDTTSMYLIDPEVSYYDHDFGIALTLFILILLIILAMALPAAQIMLNFKTRKQRYAQLYFNNVNAQSALSENQDNQIITSIPKEVPKDSLIIRILKDFSISENYKQFVSLKTPDPNLTIMNGIRSLAFMMVVLGHEYGIIAGATYKLEMARRFLDWLIVFLCDMLYSVDMFFWLGGFFVGFVLFEQKKVNQVRSQPGSIGMIFLHRILRILPCYIFAIMVNTYLGPHMGGGPRWFQSRQGFECKTGWRNMLFIDNWFGDEYYCFGWGWYLSNDIQLFVVSLIPLYFYAVNSPKLGKQIVGSLLFITQLVGTIVTFYYEFLLPWYSLQNLNQFNKYYFKPYCRGPPYFLGLLFGIMYREFKHHKQNPTTEDVPLLAQLSGWMSQKAQRRYIVRGVFYVTGFGILIFLLIGWRPAQKTGDPDYWPHWIQELWYASCRLLFTFGLTLITIPNMLGMPDIFNTTIMNNTMFKYLAKLSFTGYLVHYTVIVITGCAYYQAPDFSFATCIQFFVGCFAITCMAATFLTLLLEMPSAKLESRLLAYLAGSKQRAKSMEAPDMSDKMLKK